ncbi:hypothetical protein COJ96_14905 [Bacillus sp. AFS073361]|uniref:DUF2500 domain-containing protein n=1 Tax=Bacillus sp. AFS073361 TaxID=2033511 RepID=UPI000BF825DD|nr:DUF2500 domain-containing protein [Bacillus sp. AFS073361]PFP27523.1 hypothetical protein COJ96_14905 [Bacillus sp. AFS073361]
MGFNDGFEIFDIMFIIIPIFIVLVTGFILFMFIKGIKMWSHNNKQPRLTVAAVVVSKRLQVSGGGSDHSSSTWYYATFQVESGDRMEFSVGGREYGLLAEGDVGELHFQGTRYHGFTRNQAGA